jgi:competence protein ComEA
MKKLQLMFIAIVVFLFAFGGMSFGAHQYGKGEVNVNTATRDQLVWFLGQSGIGDVDMIADNILAYRAANGPFEKMTDLMKVNGINDAVFDRIRPRVKITGETDYDPEAVTPAPGQLEPRHDEY